jgi:hypothetical protein
MTWNDPDRECHCRIDEPIPGEEASYDDGDRTLMAHVAEFGWHIVMIPDDPQSAGWVFSVGMWHTLGTPELAVFGLEAGQAASVINLIGDHVRAGTSIGPDVSLDDVLEDERLVGFRAVDESWYGPMFGYATWFGRRPPLPIAQVVWADTKGRFPWDAEVDEGYRLRQPSLWIPISEHPQGRWSGALIEEPWSFPDPPDTAAFTSKRIAFDDHPVLVVVHNADGAWQFLDGQDVTSDDVVLVHLAHVVGANEGVVEVADLPYGWEAERATEGSPWVRRPVHEEV